jgi:hypothetical protein
MFHRIAAAVLAVATLMAMPLPARRPRPLNLER